MPEPTSHFKGNLGSRYATLTQASFCSLLNHHSVPKVVLFDAGAGVGIPLLFAHFAGFAYALGVEQRPITIHDSVGYLKCLKGEIKKYLVYETPEDIDFEQGRSAEDVNVKDFIRGKIGLEFDPLEIVVYGCFACWTPESRKALVLNVVLQNIGTIILVDFGTECRTWNRPLMEANYKIQEKKAVKIFGSGRKLMGWIFTHPRRGSPKLDGDTCTIYYL